MLTEEGAREHIDSLAAKYMGLDEYPNYDSDPGSRVIIHVEPDHVATSG
jgi:hypothetical protein